jgi:uncharacterized protein (TIGR02996 family)
MRSFTFTEGTSNKFWNIDLQGKQFTVTFGKVGTNGQTQVKAFADDAAAKKEHDKLVAEKVKKGYVEATVASAPAAPPPVPVKATAAAPPPPAPVKVAPPPPAPTPAPAPAASGKRTFEFSDASSYKFWNIERAGVALTITYGRIGAAGQTQLKSLPDEAKAAKEYDKLVAEKTGKGYRETTPSAKAQPKSLAEALEMALVENPDDLASHMAYADYLEEQGDPRGELIRIGLELEDASRPPAERKKLQAREKKLIAKHKAAFFGEFLSLIEPKDDGERDPALKCEYTLRRGWVDSLKLDYYHVEDMRRVARSPELRLLRTLDLGQTGYEDDDYERGDDIPEDTYYPQLFPLARASNLANVREFFLGDSEAREGMDDLQYGTSCHTPGDGVLGVIKQMPKVEEIHLYAHRVDTTQLFGLKTLDYLRVLRVYHNNNYPLAVLAKNPSLGRLTHLLTHPHAMDGEHPYIRTPAVKALVNSTTLLALTHMQLRLSDMGDKGVKEIVASGILTRLKVLDLQHGCVSDKGADLIAKCADAKKLERLDLMDNALSPAGVAALEAAGVEVRAAHQWEMQPGQTLEDWLDGEGFLFAGDIE